MKLSRSELTIQALAKARKSLESGEKSRARQYAAQASKLDPGLEEPWLILAAVSPPEESLIYLHKAIEINPQSEKAKAGMRWATEQIENQPKALIKNTKIRKQTHKEQPTRKFKWEIPLFTSILITGLVVVFLAGFAPFSAQAAGQNSIRPQGALIKPTLTPTATPTPKPTPIPTPTPEPTADTYFADYTYHSWDIPDEVSSGNTFWIEVDLTNQMLYAYRGSQLISGFLVSTGTSSHKTVTGTFKIYEKWPTHTMIGPGYHLDDVPYTMYFYKGYALHGTYWHHNFGTPMSHGCVNMVTSDAAWVYDNAPVGTYVFIHY